MTAATEKSRTVFRIREWDKKYERSRSRELQFLEYVPFPNLMPDLSYVRLISHTNGAAHFGLWSAMVFIASRCPIRGTFTTDAGEPLSLTDIASVSRIPEVIVVEAIPRFIQLGWLESVPLVESPRADVRPQPQAKNGHANSHTPQLITEFDAWWKLWADGTGQSSDRAGAEKQWGKSVPREDVSKAMVCTKNFVTCDRTVRGIGIPNPSKFIRENARTGWESRWTQPKKSRGDRIEENLMRMHADEV